MSLKAEIAAELQQAMRDRDQTRLGTLRVRLGDRAVLERPVVALDNVEAAGWFGRAWDTIKLWIQ